MVDIQEKVESIVNLQIVHMWHKKRDDSVPYWTTIQLYGALRDALTNLLYQEGKRYSR